MDYCTRCTLSRYDYFLEKHCVSLLRASYYSTTLKLRDMCVVFLIVPARIRTVRKAVKDSRLTNETNQFLKIIYLVFSLGPVRE